MHVLKLGLERPEGSKSTGTRKFKDNYHIHAPHLPPNITNNLKREAESGISCGVAVGSIFRSIFDLFLIF